MNEIGIMQGRLVPPEGGRLQSYPRQRWREEFERAARVPLACIEWIYDGYGADVNPLMTEGGIDDLRRLMDSTGVTIKSVCADYFMEQPLARSVEARDVLRKLLANCHSLGVQRIVLPFVDNSEITPGEFNTVVELVKDAAHHAAEVGIELNLESSLAPAEFADLLSRLPETVKVNYDSGNSASLGYAPADEFAAIGDRIGSVHIKDRVLGGSTVPLGYGSTDFAAMFNELRRISYTGDFVLQVARGEAGQEEEWARTNLAFVRRHWPATGA